MTETNGAVAVASGAELLAHPTSTYVSSPSYASLCGSQKVEPSGPIHNR